MCLIAFTDICAAEPAVASLVKLTHIPAQPLMSALEQFAHDRNLQLIYVTADVSNLRSGGAAGNLTAAQVLDRLLHDTPLTYEFVDDHTVTVEPVLESVSPAPATGNSTGSIPPNRIRLSQIGGGIPAASESGGRNASPEGDSQLEQVVVTAQKKTERLSEVPIPVTALGGPALADQNHFRLQDYAGQIPGFTATSNDSASGPVIAIRGIAPASFGNPTVGVMVDDVPFGSAVAFGGGFVAPELDPSDLSRIEVLRGPQGTLYGASSMGGLLKYVTVDPSTDAASGRVQAGTSFAHNGPKPGYNFSGAFNEPLGDTLAVRVSGFLRRDPGFIENVRDADRGVNEAKLGGLHVSTLWKPADDFSLKLSALFQRNQAFGMSYQTTEPGLADLQQDFLPHTGVLSRSFSAYSATIDAKLGIFNLTSVTGFNINKEIVSIDNTAILGPLTLGSFPLPYTVEEDGFNARKFTQELRLNTTFWNQLDWLYGVFYTHEDTPTYTTYTATDVNSVPLGPFLLSQARSIYSEWSAFTDLTWRINDRWDIQVGARESQMWQSSASADSGIYVPAIEGTDSPNIYPRGHAYENAFTYLLTPRFRLTPDIMLYARLASGFRPGGVNQGFLPPELPRQFQPDKTQNYEIGLKGDFLDHRVSVDASLYHIDWKNIQVSLLVPDNSITYYSNGSAAKSQGAELSIQTVPVRGLKIGGWASWNDAKLTRSMPAGSVVYGATGDRLAYSVRFSANMTVDYSFPLGSYTGSVGGAESYVGNRLGAFQPTPERQLLPAYATTDLRAELARDNWTLDLFLNNATDRRALVGGGLGTTFPNSFDVISPRTVALSVARTF
jgi:outer membrane receptor protein involved in Fe transport